MQGGMDLSVLPNNNHPDKFLQLDVKSLMRNSALLQASLVRFPGGNYPAAQHWQNLVYSQKEWAQFNVKQPEEGGHALRSEKENKIERKEEYYCSTHKGIQYEGHHHRREPPTILIISFEE